MRIGRATGVLPAVAALLMAAAPAWADHHDANLPWPEMLPAQEVPVDVQPHPVRNCRRAGTACIDGLLRRLRAQWVPLDRACDHRALFSLAYLRITKGLRATRFRYPRWMDYVITTFSNRWFRAFRDYEAGRPLPASWRITFDEAAKGDANGGQDVLLASNAHTQHDLPYVYAEQGMRTPRGASRKADHDRVNAVNTAVFDGLEDEYARRYDPFFKWIDMSPSPLDEIGTQEMVKSWREGAWRNGERLMNAKTPAERRRVEGDIETTSRLWAEWIASGHQPGHRAERDAYCRAR